MIFTTALNMTIAIIGMILGFIITAIPFVGWLTTRPKKTSNDYTSKYIRSFESFADDHMALTLISMFIGAIMLTFCIGWHCSIASNVRINKINEPVIYQQMMVERVSTVDALNTTDDVVNTDLYNRVIDFNTRLTEYQTKSVNDEYRHNFTGDYDWSVIQHIDLKGELGK